jgi:P-type conjugative transfer protein TrbL
MGNVIHTGVGLLATAPNQASIDSMNEVFRSSVEVLTTNAGATTSAGGSVLLGLATIEFILFLYGAYMAREMAEVVNKAVQKAFFIFIVATVFFNWGTLANWTKGYIVGGASAAGGASSMVQTLNPAYVASEGFDKVAVIFNSEAQDKMAQGLFGTDAAADKARARSQREAKLRANQSAFDSFVATAEGYSPDAMIEAMSETGEQFALQLFALLLFGTLGLLIVCVYVYCAAMMFVISIEFYIVVVMTKLLVPFALNKHTSGLATAAMNAVVSKAVQLGVLVLVLSMFGKSMSSLSLGPSPTLYEVLALLGTSAFMAFAVSRVPAIAASIFAGAGAGMDIGGALIAGAAAAGAAAANVVAPGAGAALKLGAEGAGATASAGVKATAAAAGATGRAGASLAGKVAASAPGSPAGTIARMVAGQRDASGLGAARGNLARAEEKMANLASKKSSPAKVSRAAREVEAARAAVDAIEATPQGRLDAAQADFKELARSGSGDPGALRAAAAEVDAAQAALSSDQVATSGASALAESDQTTGRVRGEVMEVGADGSVAGEPTRTSKTSADAQSNDWAPSQDVAGGGAGGEDDEEEGS